MRIETTIYPTTIDNKITIGVDNGKNLIYVKCSEISPDETPFITYLNKDEVLYLAGLLSHYAKQL